MLNCNLMTDLLSALQGRVLVCDGAMGTMLYKQGRLSSAAASMN